MRGILFDQRYTFVCAKKYHTIEWRSLATRRKIIINLLKNIIKLFQIKNNIAGIQHTIYVIGRGDMIRTCDSLVPNQVLYQAELHPDSV